MKSHNYVSSADEKEYVSLVAISFVNRSSGSSVVHFLMTYSTPDSGVCLYAALLASSVTKRATQLAYQEMGRSI